LTGFSVVGIVTGWILIETAEGKKLRHQQKIARKKE
jgi:hypothetical protein